MRAKPHFLLPMSFDLLATLLSAMVLSRRMKLVGVVPLGMPVSTFWLFDPASCPAQRIRSKVYCHP